jgi:hypothetical protein
MWVVAPLYAEGSPELTFYIPLLRNMLMSESIIVNKTEEEETL